MARRAEVVTQAQRSHWAGPAQARCPLGRAVLGLGQMDGPYDHLYMYRYIQIVTCIFS